MERDHVVRTLMDAEAAVSLDVLKDFATGYHARNGGGDSIRTDGDLPVVDLRALATGSETAGAATASVVPAATAAPRGEGDAS